MKAVKVENLRFTFPRNKISLFYEKVCAIMKFGQLCLWKKEDPHSTKHVLDESADSRYLHNAFRADKYQCFWHVYVCHELVQPR